ncbi:MAG: hypothetical protein KBH99_01725 [Syntrophobacteraceae bacterium]|nr:hypothetical protein [Syntrophobacteraceae bacterium]
MESGDYAGFLEENRDAIEECTNPLHCQEALFNLGFLHAYSKSPYYNPAKALWYFEEIIRKYPGSSYAYQAGLLVDLLRSGMTSEDRRRHLQGVLKSREAELRSRESRLKGLDEEIKSKETAIEELNERLQRSREIDMKMDRKERELLQ